VKKTNYESVLVSRKDLTNAE